MPKAEPHNGLGPLLSKEQLAEFKQLYKKQFGVELSDAEALDKAIHFLGLVEAISRPMPAEAETHTPIPEESDTSSSQFPQAGQTGGQLRLL